MTLPNKLQSAYFGYIYLDHEGTFLHDIKRTSNPVSRIIGTIVEGIFRSMDDIYGSRETLEHKAILSWIDFWGKEFHLHLYTAKSDASLEDLQRLERAGLDEIRFHPQNSNWSGIKHAIALGMNVGIEVPVIPGQTKKLTDLAQKAEKIGVEFLNLNELEASETNFDHLVSMGMRLTSLDKASIAGSAETAREVIEWASSNLSDITVHFCSARYKDAVQLRNRLERRLERVIRPFEIRDDEEPLLILGIIRAPHGQQLNADHLKAIFGYLQKEYDVPSDLMSLDHFRNRIEIAPWILEELAQELKHHFAQSRELEIGIAYEYPSWDRLQTLFEPL